MGSRSSTDQVQDLALTEDEELVWDRGWRLRSAWFRLENAHRAFYNRTERKRLQGKRYGHPNQSSRVRSAREDYHQALDAWEDLGYPRGTAEMFDAFANHHGERGLSHASWRKATAESIIVVLGPPKSDQP